MIWIVTEAKRTGIRRLELGHSLSEFLKKLSLNPHRRGIRSDAQRIKEALRRLLGCTITYRRKLQDSEFVVGEHIRECKVAPERELWWDPRPQDQAILWGSWIEIGEELFASIMESSVPFNLDAIAALRSPLALDLYLLCNWIGSNLHHWEKKEHFVTWGMLARQLGGDYAHQDDLKKKIQKLLREQVKMIHTELNVKCTVRKINGVQQGGLLIRPSEPAVPYRPRSLRAARG